MSFCCKIRKEHTLKKTKQKQTMLYILLTLFQTVFSATANEPEKPKSDLDPAKMYFLNWSTCDEFSNNTSLNISDIIDIDWKIFYYWNHDLEDSYIVRFSIPSPMVNNYSLSCSAFLLAL